MQQETKITHDSDMVHLSLLETTLGGLDLEDSGLKTDVASSEEKDVEERSGAAPPVSTLEPAASLHTTCAHSTVM